MSHKSRSIANTRFEARRIYHQRRMIRNLEQENAKLKEENTKLKKQLKKYNKIKEMFKSGVVDLIELKNTVLGDELNERK